MTVIALMVPKEKLSRINGISQLATAISQMVGPIFGALLMAIIPKIENILWIDVFTFVIALVLLLRVKIPHIESKVGDASSDQKFKAKFKEGFQIIRNIRGLTTILFLAMITNFFLMPINTQFSLFIYRDHGGSELDMAFISAGMQFAIVAGALATSLKKEWKNKVNIFVFGILLVFIGIGIMAVVSRYASRYHPFRSGRRAHRDQIFVLIRFAIGDICCGSNLYFFTHTTYD